MKLKRQTRMRQTERGIALLISIFVLLLISVVAIALIVSSGTESALAGNYRSSTGVYYAALAGLEEARGRLAVRTPNSFKTTTSGFLPAPGLPFAIGIPIYVINPAGAETVAPWDPGSTYPDTEYQTEFASSPPNPSPSALSIWNTGPLNTLPVPVPLYKWVRINAVSEKSLNVDVDSIGGANSTTPLYYDGAHFSNNSAAGPQVLEITSYAVLPNGSQKLLQYLTTRSDLDLSFPSALTLVGGVNTFNSSMNSDFFVNGLDQQHGGTCPPAAAEGAKPAIGATGLTARNAVLAGIPPYATSPTNVYRYDHYISTSPQPTNPSVGDISGTLIPAFQTVNSLDGPQGFVQIVTGLADQVVTGPATNGNLADLGTPTRSVTTVIRGDPPNGGDLTLTGNLSGYGLLVVTGNLTLGGDVSWHGVSMGVGQGSVTVPSYGYGTIDGAILVAQTRDTNYSLRSSLGSITFDIPNPNYGNSGIFYNSCWVQAVMPPATYKILSFHEISQP